MKKTIFISGVSKGIGKALAEESLNRLYEVYGIGRQNPLKNKLNFLELDLLNNDLVKSFEFPELDTEEVILINNAGLLGELGLLSEKKEFDTNSVFQVNTISPIILTQKFIKKYRNKKIQIINISSGAARRAISGWANYCASKTAIDSFSVTLQDEFLEQNINGRVFAIAPGVVNTSMQNSIRESELDFPTKSNYKNLMKNNELLSPEFVGNKILKLLENPDSVNKIILNINEL